MLVTLTGQRFRGKGVHHHNLIVARTSGKTKTEVNLCNWLGNLGDAANTAYLEGSGLRGVGIRGPNSLTPTKNFHDLEDKCNKGRCYMWHKCGTEDWTWALFPAKEIAQQCNSGLECD